jgi:pyrimidine operon attenuation protein/uracil phosphoribosyltransferase
MEGNFIRRGILGRRDHIIDVSRANDSQWNHLIDTGIRGVQLRRDCITVDIPGENASQIVLYALFLNVHAIYFDRSALLTSTSQCEERQNLPSKPQD